jgi:hypothetical protein
MLHVAGWTWAVSTRVYLESCISLSPQSRNFWIHPRIMLCFSVATMVHERAVVLRYSSVPCLVLLSDDQVSITQSMRTACPYDFNKFTIPSGTVCVKKLLPITGLWPRV